MPSTWATIKPERASKCPTPGHTSHVAGCTSCRRRSVYLRALAIWERANGVDHAYVPVDDVRAHIAFLTTEGHRTIVEIADASGVSARNITRIMSGHCRKLFPITAKSLLAIGPAEAAGPPRRTAVPAVEGSRLLQGLFAQGWTGRHLGDLLGGLSRAAAPILANSGRPWMERDTLDRIRVVAAKIGGLDVAQLPSPLPGMDRRTARAAARNGWHKISDWNGLDITDPDADPDAPLDTFLDEDPAEFDDDLVDVEVAFIDPAIIKTINETAVRIKLGTSDYTGRIGDVWIPRLQGLRQLELHAAWWYAENAGLNDTHIGFLLGYDMSAESVEAGQRQINRIRARVLAARAWSEQHPHGQVPDWITKSGAQGRRNIDNVLPALIAVQPAPFGAGWTVEQLADACGVPTETAAYFMAAATDKGNMVWHPQTHAPARTRRPDRRTQPALAQAAA